MKRYFFLFFATTIFLIAGFASQAQVTKAPDAVKKAFAQKYPDATNTDYSNKLVETDVTFTENGAACKAKFSNDGQWQGTSIKIKMDALPAGVHDGFNKSKYSDWQVDGVYEIYQPQKNMEYEIEVEKSALQKKNLFFDVNGKLLRDNITI